MTASLVVTVVGPDRPGIVNEVSDVARRFDANWAGSRMASLAGQFAGMVHFQVRPERADDLARELAKLQQSGLQVVIARSDAATATASGTRRIVALELVGQDRPGIVREVSGRLAAAGVSIEELRTEFESAPMSGEQLFRMSASLAVPEHLSDSAIQSALESVANEMMVDISVGAETDADDG